MIEIAIMRIYNVLKFNGYIMYMKYVIYIYI